MARTHPRKSHLLGFAKKSSSAAGLASPPGRPEARAGDLTSMPGTSGPASPGMLARAKRFFRRPNTGAGGGAQEESEAVPDAGAAGNDVGTAVKEFAGLRPVPHIANGAIDAVGIANTTFSEIQNLSDTYLKPFKVFNQVVSTLANVHPYARIALGVLTSIAQLVINQAKVDKAVSDLLDEVQSVYEFLTEEDSINNIDNMRDTLAKIAQAISDSAQFITNYSETKNLWIRAAKNIFSETQTAVDGYAKTLDSLMQQYRDRAVRDTHVNTYRILEDLSLDGMAYAGGAGLNKTKKCLDGTREDILQEIIDWINDPNVRTPRILWLHGHAGRGKSAIAHTIASWIKGVGGLGSCFCFARDRQAEHREEKILTTIARDLADRDLAFRRALADVVSKDHSLKTTPDVVQQWEQLILEPLSNVNGPIVGKVVVVIDALDESGPEKSREQILSLLTSPEAARLPSNFRIFLTSRPLPDIKRVLSTAMHVKAISLDSISAASAERDIRLYVSSEFCDLPEIGATEVQNIAEKSDGLFEWARLACEFVKPNRPGRTVMERYKELMFPHSGGGGALLDVMYKTILEDMVPPDEDTLARFRSVMQQIMSMVVPRQLDTLNEMRSHFPPEKDRFDMIIILEFMAPLLSGITDRCSVVRPLHASFYDFLTDPSRSGVYCVGASSTGMDGALAFASLDILHKDLKFNICGLDSSYCCNSEVADLQEKINRNISLKISYSCQYWANHLQKVVFDPTLALLVKGVVGSEKILFWLEILSLIGRVAGAMSALGSTMSWLHGQDGFEETLALAQDGIKFVQNFGSVISQSTPHLYVSALPLIPSNTILARILKPKFCYLARVSVGGLKEWPAAQVGMWGDTDGVLSVGFSSDGKMIVMGSSDKTVRMWDAERGVQIGGTLEGHTGVVWSVAFSSDCKRIVTGSSDKTVRIWDVERAVQIGDPLKGHTGVVWSVTFSSDHKRIVSGSADNTVRIWDVGTGVQEDGCLQEHSGSINSVQSSDGRRIPLGSENNMVWDTCGHEAGQSKCVASNPQNASLLSHIISPYPICFSSVSSHALLDTQPLHDGCLEEDINVTFGSVKLFNHGWIRGPKGRLLLWIPPSFWCQFYSMWNTVGKDSCIELDLSQMAHGTKWHQCFKPVV